MTCSCEINTIKYFENHLVEYVQTTSSTNDDLKKQWPSSARRILIAEEQTSGRGQLDRSWSSEKGNGIYFSFTWQISVIDFEKMLPLSMLSGVVVYETIKKLTQDNMDKIWIKWPNDIWLNDKKLGGILVESYFDEKNVNFVIGIGINLFPFETSKLSTSGLSEIIAAPTTDSFLQLFFKTWSNIIELKTEKQLQLWKIGANKFFNLKHRLSKSDGTQLIVQPMGVHINGTISVREESGNIHTLNSCQKLTPKLDK